MDWRALQWMSSGQVSSMVRGFRAFKLDSACGPHGLSAWTGENTGEDGCANPLFIYIIMRQVEHTVDMVQADHCRYEPQQRDWGVSKNDTLPGFFFSIFQIVAFNK
jgi:hypothetical protein